jgi:hypothetical protein
MRLTGAFITLCALVFVSGIAGCWPTRFQIPDAHHRWLRVIIRRLDRHESR